MEQASQMQTSTDIPQIAGNLWWDDVRQGVGFLFTGLAIYLVPFLIGRFLFADWFNGIFYVVSAVLILLGMKTCLSAPSESKAGPLALATLGCTKLIVIGFIVLLVIGRLDEFGIALLVLGLLANILLALFIRKTAEYLRARSLALLALQYAMMAGLLSVAILVAALLKAHWIADALTLLLIGIQLFLLGHLLEAIGRAQEGISPKATKTVAAAAHDAPAVAHAAEPDPIPVVPAPYFTEQQWEKLETSDVGAGRAVVGLMTAIFLIGVVLYSIVALTVIF